MDNRLQKLFVYSADPGIAVQLYLDGRGAYAAFGDRTAVDFPADEFQTVCLLRG